MRLRCGILGIGLAAAVASAAAAQDICPPLSKLVADPPAGFLADRADALGPQRWMGVPFLPNATCVVWASRSAEAHNIRCTVNDGAAPTAVAAFYQGTSSAIDRCLAAAPDGSKYVRRTAQVEVEGLKGVETVWVRDTDTLRMTIDLTDYRRSFDGSSYNSFSVEYLKY